MLNDTKLNDTKLSDTQFNFMHFFVNECWDLRTVVTSQLSTLSGKSIANLFSERCQKIDKKIEEPRGVSENYDYQLLASIRYNLKYEEALYKSYFPQEHLKDIETYYSDLTKAQQAKVNEYISKIKENIQKKDTKK